MTAPMAVDRPPAAAGGFSGLAVAVNGAMREIGGAEALRVLARAHGRGRTGFACPGCSWPARDNESICEAGARTVADQATARRATPLLFETYTVAELAERSDHWLNRQGRLTEPMVLHPGADGYVSLPWDEAIALVAEQLAALADQPDRAVFYTSGRASNEGAFALRSLAEQLGVESLPHSSQFCRAPSDAALDRLPPPLRRTATVADLEGADAVFCLGHNPGSNHPRMLRSLAAAKRGGATIVAVNPLPEAGLHRFKDLRRPGEWFGSGTELADLYLPVRVGEDRAVIAALIKGALEHEAHDRAWLDAHATGLEALVDATARLDWAELAARSGIAEPDLRAAAQVFARAERPVVSWGAGLTQHVDGTQTVSAVLTALALRGHLGREGSGPMPIHGHDNSAGSLRALGRPRGRDLPTSLEAMHAGEVDVLLSLGGNLISAAADTSRIAEAIRRCRLTVHVATKLNRSHLVTGATALLLPCLARSDRDPSGATSTQDGSGRRVLSRGRREPPSRAVRGEAAIFAAIAEALAGEEPAWAGDNEAIRARLDAPSPADGPGPAPDPSDDDGPERVELGCSLAAPVALADDELRMTTLRSHDQHNTIVYDHGDRLRGVRGYRRLVFMSLADLDRLGLAPYDQVDLSATFAGRTRTAPRWVVVPHAIPTGCCATYFPEANAIVPFEARDATTGTFASKSVVVSVRKSDPLPERKLLKRLRR